VSANLIFAINYDSGIPYLEKNVLWQGAAFFVRAQVILV
jgi:hypothetical protein